LDNTNLLPYYCSPHVRLALFYGYEFEIVEPDSPWRYDIGQLSKRNLHNVPVKILENMKANLLSLPKEALFAILSHETPMDPELLLRDAQTSLEKADKIHADECIMDYLDWRRVSGFEPDGGDQLVESIGEKLEGWSPLDNWSPNDWEGI